ncbi:MAG: dTMP kinase [Stackebrandtia sp.]
MAHDNRRATIAFVGIDGAGKTTQAKRLTLWLSQQGHQVQYRLAANGRRVLGNAARRVGRADSVALLGPRLAIRTETVLRHANLSAARRGRVLVADRYDVCQFARTRMVCPEMEPWVRRRMGSLPEADLLLYLTVPPETAHARVKSRGIDFEPLERLVALDDAYRSLPESDNFTYVDASAEPDAVTDVVRDKVCTALPQLFAD